MSRVTLLGLLMMLCAAHDVDPQYAACIVERESHWQADATGALGEMGLAQIHPASLPWLEKVAGFAPATADPYDPVDALIILVRGLDAGYDEHWRGSQYCEGE